MRRHKLYRMALIVCALVYGYLCLRILGIHWFGCILRNATGIPCPSCGVTTGVIALAHGDIIKSLRCNPLAPLLAAGFILTQLLILYDLLFKGDTLVRAYIIARRALRSRLFLTLGAILIILVWTYKLLATYVGLDRLFQLTGI